MSRVVKLKNLGRLSYASALKVQHQLVNQHIQNVSNGPNVHGDEILDTLLIVEHNPVYTIGIRTAGYDEKDQHKLKALGAEYHQTDRGGLITFHGPGQLIAYPILNLGTFGKKSVKWYVCALQNCLIRTCQQFGLTQAATCEHTGVWVNDNKIAAIGINCRRHITSHGIALNCNVDLKWFNHIIPCGIADRGVTSLTSELGYEVGISETLPKFINAFKEVFQCNVVT